MAFIHFKKRKSVHEATPESPIYFGPVSNGEYFPRQKPAEAAADRLVHRIADSYAGRLGMTRREYLESARGMAAALFAINMVSGCGDSKGGFNVNKQMLCDESAAREVLKGDEFIFDVQTHHFNVEAGAEWMKNTAYNAFLLLLNQVKYDGYLDRGEALPPYNDGSVDGLKLLSRDTYIYEMFVASDTTLAVLTGIPATGDSNPLKNDEIAESRDLINCLAGGGQRVLNHAMVLPNLSPDPQEEFDAMVALQEEFHTVAGWKSYTAWGPNGQGYFLDSGLGDRYLQFIQDSGTPLLNVHKGLPIPTFDMEHNDPRDIGPTAKNFPGVNIVVYHSGYDSDYDEGPYDPDLPQGEQFGINRLIKSVQDAGLGTDANVYAELGSTWAAVMKDAVQAQHVIGKLLKYIGENRVVWGTDSVWYGSPQAQIEAMRALTISEEFQDKFGYPELTPAIKAKIFGLNAAPLYGIDPEEERNVIREDFQSLWLQEAIGDQAVARPRVYGPTTRRDVLNLIRAHNNMPG